MHLASDLRQQTQMMGMDPQPSGIGNMNGTTTTPLGSRQAGPIPGSFPNTASTSYTVPHTGNTPGMVAQVAGPPRGTMPTATTGTPGLTKGSSSTDSGDAPGTPGMMDIDMQMDDDEPPSSSQDVGMGFGGAAGGVGGGLGISTAVAPQDAYYKGPPLQFVQPSMLSYTIPPPSASTTATPANHMAFNGAGQGAIGRVPRPGGINTQLYAQPSPMHSGSTPSTGGSGGHHLTDAQKAERAARKAARKEAKRIARENGEAESSDDGRDAEGFKKYRCPVEGCNKSYKQANGLKYHLK